MCFRNQYTYLFKLKAAIKINPVSNSLAVIQYSYGMNVQLLYFNIDVFDSMTSIKVTQT